MEIKNWKIILGIGVLLIVLGFYVLTFDFFVGILAIGFGGWNTFKGIRIMKGHQPYLIRKYNEQNKQTESRDE